MNSSLRKLAFIILLSQPTMAFALTPIGIPLLGGWGLGGLTLLLGMIAYISSRKDK